jgi:hypothetical protein
VAFIVAVLVAPKTVLPKTPKLPVAVVAGELMVTVPFKAFIK